MTALIGLQVWLPDHCKCGADTAVIGDGNGKFAATLACPQCGNSRGAISGTTPNRLVPAPRAAVPDRRIAGRSFVGVTP